jgi:hypothetical protein
VRLGWSMNTPCLEAPASVDPSARRVAVATPASVGAWAGRRRWQSTLGSTVDGHVRGYLSDLTGGKGAPLRQPVRADRGSLDDHQPGRLVARSATIH